ncbi:MAG: restriction endonuclease subunit S [Bacteroidales bacterium]|nr:restriction endonuclease subunit S [Bacteroidales bacterium]MCF8455719.1 restriction endonuclease subunit S [Bacteroidales bacterium]
MKPGWEQKTLGDVLEILRNGVNCKQDKKGIGDKISRIESISNANFDIDKVGFTTLSKSDKEKYRLESGDILFSHINSPIHVGKTALFNSNEEVYHGVNLLLMRPKPFLNGSYFEHFLKFLFQKGYWKGLCKQSVNQASVNQQDINKVEINYPKSLPEQKTIVSILDQAFAAIAKAKANAEQNLNNAKALFESYLQGVFENDKWKYTKLSNLTTGITDGDHMPPPKSDTGIPFITISNINKNDNQIDFSNTFKVPDEYYLNIKDNRKPKKGDVLYTVTGSYGIPVLIEENKMFCFQRHIGLIRPKDELESKLLYYWILSPQAKKQADSTATGTAQKTVSLKSLRNFQFPIITIEEQLVIINAIDDLSIKTKKLETIYQKKIDDLEELKKSILQKAFNGEM